MKDILLILFLCTQLNFHAHASDIDANAHRAAVDSAVANSPAVTVTSPSHRVALLELYTSEGCSSCPPADRVLNN